MILDTLAHIAGWATLAAQLIDGILTYLAMRYEGAVEGNKILRFLHLDEKDPLALLIAKIAFGVGSVVVFDYWKPNDNVWFGVIGTLIMAGVTAEVAIRRIPGLIKNWPK